MKKILATMVAGIGLLVFMSGCASQTNIIGTEEETAIFEDSVQNDSITTEEDMDMTEKCWKTKRVYARQSHAFWLLF